MNIKHPGMALMLAVLLHSAQCSAAAHEQAVPATEAVLPLVAPAEAVAPVKPPVKRARRHTPKPSVNAAANPAPPPKATPSLKAIARAAAPVAAKLPAKAVLRAAPPLDMLVDDEPSVDATPHPKPPDEAIMSAAPRQTAPRAAPAADAIVRAAPAPLKPVANPAPAVEAVLRAADEARGNVTGLGWEVTIESAEHERVTDSLVYDIKVRSFNVAGLSLAPPKYRGNKILMLNTNMWFYKPGLSKPVPISLRQKLMGDAAYGDIASTNYAEHYNAIRLSDDVVNGKECYVFDLRAKAEKVTYDRIIYWVEKQRQLGVKAEYFTVSGKKFKSASMDYGNTVKLDGKPHPFLSRITMHGELLDGAVTYLHLRSPRIEPIPDYVFDLNLFMR